MTDNEAPSYRFFFSVKTSIDAALTNCWFSTICVCSLATQAASDLFRLTPKVLASFPLPSVPFLNTRFLLLYPLFALRFWVPSSQVQKEDGGFSTFTLQAGGEQAAQACFRVEQLDFHIQKDAHYRKWERSHLRS